MKHGTPVLIIIRLSFSIVALVSLALLDRIAFLSRGFSLTLKFPQSLRQILFFIVVSHGFIFREQVSWRIS